MANRLASAILLALGTSALFAACDDGDDRVDGMVGGEAGEAGKKTGGSSSGGTSAGKGGTGGAQAGGGEMQGGEGPGSAGEGGDMGGGPLGGSGGADGGAVGMGGEGGAGPSVVLACGSSTINHRLCSALIAADCGSLPECGGDPPQDPCCVNCGETPTCPDCVPLVADQRQPWVGVDCPACLAEYDRHLLCGIEPFEAGNLSDGVACYDYVGAAVHDENCYPLFQSAEACLSYVFLNPCPDTWPLEGTGGAGGSDGS